MPEKMRAVSLFSGALAGGFEIGFDRAGIETVLQAEQDPWCLKVLARHWPQTERVTDVRSVGRADGADGGERDRGSSGNGAPSRWSAGAGDIDLVYGGFPCQDLSVAGKRAGLEGERSGLWFEFHRVLRELRPRWAVIENVPGLLSSNQGRDFGIVLAGLEELGFDVAWAVLDAKHFGVPQRRRRVFIVAGPSRRACEQVLSLCESCGGNPAEGGTPGQDVARPLGASATSFGGHRNDLDNETYVVASAVSASSGHHSHSSPRGDGSDNLVPVTVGSLSDGAHHGGGLNGQDAYSGRIFPQAQGVRRLTPLECERIMGWPDDWTRYADDGSEIADSHRYRMCGNGVVATCAEWIGRRLMAVDAML